MTSRAESQDRRDPSPPRKLGKYEVLEVIGRGAMGVVYRAYDPYTGRDVAIKVGTSHLSDEGNQLSRRLFFNEARLAGLLSHPNILSVYDAGEDDGRPYLVMEYVDGARTLKAHCQPDSLLAIRQVGEIVYRCARALDYAHRCGVVHRDIKASNILLTPEDDVKVADFGIARRLHTDTTQVMGMIGSPRYMSPEQAIEEDVGHQTDLYSLGVVLYELLTGRPPFEAETLHRLIYKIVHEQPVRPRDLRGDLPPAPEEITLQAMQKDRTLRYATGADLAADLARLFDELGGVEVDVSARERFNALRPLSFFREFSDAEVWEVLRAGTWEAHRMRDEIVQEGAIEGRFYVVVSGEVMVKKGSRTLSSLGPGDCFGEVGSFGKGPRSASILAMNAVTVLGVNAAVMENASCQLQAKFLRAFVRALIARLTRTSSALTHALSRT
jgi:serine/threonine protein kinase